MHSPHDDTFLHDLVRDTIERWRAGERPDAAALLARHPAIARHKNLAIDLIYEEFCLRRELGDTLVPSTFCDRFPHYRQSLSRMLEVDDALKAHPDLQPLAGPIVWPKAGDSFMGFELVEILGRGSLARVFLARETAVGDRLVVVKVSRHGATEAQMLGKAAHPGIVPILSVTHDDATDWTVICMPLLGTATATDLMDAAFAKGQPPSSAEVISRVANQFRPVGVQSESASAGDLGVARTSYADGIARFALQLAEGLQAAHDAGVMHRDIKPSNVLIAWSGRPMLLDFNLSADVGLRSGRERVGGTLAYMAPELIQAMLIDRGASARQFDPRADIFSLGALLYELLTGRLPSQPKNADRLAPDAFAPWLEARRRPVVPPRELNPQIDPALEAIVLRCLAAEPEGRQASASELVSALRDYLGWAPAAGRQMRRHRRTLLLMAAGAVVLAVGAAVYIGRLPPPDLRLYEQGLHQFDRGEYDAAQESFRRCIELKPDWSEARFAHGQALRKKGDIAAARAEFLALRDYDLALAYSLAGYCDLVMGNLGGAEADYGLAIQAGANDPTTLNNSGLCAASQGALKRAIDYLDSALAQDPDLAAARCQRAIFSFQESLSTGKLPSKRVLSDIREACRLAPDRADFHFHAAAILAMAMKSDQSLKDEALRHLMAALEGGHPPQAVLLNRSKFGILLDEIPRELLKGPLVRKPGKPPVLYVSPSETADLSTFIRR